MIIRALRGELDEEIDKTITNTGEYGFEVDCEAFRKVLNSTSTIKDSNQHTDLNCKIGKNCDFLKKEIELEIMKNVLPDWEGLLVLITSIKSASDLQKTGVWRGLSNRFEFEEWVKYSTSNTLNKSDAQKKTMLMGIIVAIILIIAIAWIIIQLTRP